MTSPGRRMSWVCPVPSGVARLLKRPVHGLRAQSRIRLRSCGIWRSVDVSVTDELLATAARCHRQLFNRVLRSVPAANVDIVLRLRAEGLRVAVLSNCDVLEIEAWN